jgi:hypothetical protein
MAGLDTNEPDDERLVPFDFTIKGHISAGTFPGANFGFSERLEKGGFKRLLAEPLDLGDVEGED